MADGRAEAAGRAFEGGLNCAQAVFGAFAEDAGMNAGSAARAAAPFGAGMGRMQLTCGAVTGAFMAIGLYEGNAGAEDAAGRERAYAFVKEFSARFKGMHGSLSCAELLGCDLNSPEGQAAFKAKGLRTSVCLACVRDAAAIVESLLAEGDKP